MNTRLYHGLAVLIAVALAGCASGTGEDPTGIALAVHADQAFTLAVGETAILEGEHLTVRLLGVRDDSRCPVDVVCVWAGDAVADIEVVHAGAEHAYELHANPGDSTGPGTVGVAGYCLSLEAVVPEPQAEQPIAQRDYRVTLRIGSGRLTG